MKMILRHRERDVNLMELKWQPGATTTDGDQIALGVDAEGKWYAFHEKPYFCFEEKDRLAAVDLATRALVWYRRDMRK